MLERLERVRSLENRLAGLKEQIVSEVPEASFECHDPELELVFEQGHQVAATDAVVLIRGESGTGKGVLARAIHAWSRRAAAPFVTVSCPSLNAELLESELFGHARGSFTGRRRRHRGQGRGGRRRDVCSSTRSATFRCLLQPKLLRFLQERRYERVGETRTRSCRRSLDRGVQPRPRSGRRRRASSARTCSSGSTSSSWRCRRSAQRSDRLELAEHMLAFFARQIGKRIEGFAAEAREAMLRYAWPGNLRELRNAIERAVIFAAGPIARPGRPAQPRRDGRRRTPSPGPAGPIEVGQPVSLEQLETEHIRLILRRSPTLRGRRAHPGNRPEHPLSQAQATRALTCILHDRRRRLVVHFASPRESVVADRRRDASMASEFRGAR